MVRNEVVTYLHTVNAGTLDDDHDQQGVQPGCRQGEERGPKGPVFITDRGRASHVLLTVEDFQEMTGAEASIAEWLAMPEATDIDFRPPRLEVMTKPADLA